MLGGYQDRNEDPRKSATSDSSEHHLPINNASIVKSYRI